jgi:hypothetical protein
VRVSRDEKIDPMNAKRLAIIVLSATSVGWIGFSLWTGYRSVDTREKLVASLTTSVFLGVLFAAMKWIKWNKRRDTDPQLQSRVGRMSREEMITGLESIFSDPSASTDQKAQAGDRLSKLK